MNPAQSLSGHSAGEKHDPGLSKFFFPLCLSIKMIKPKPSVCPLPLFFSNDFQSFKDTKYVAKMVFYTDESSH